MTPDDNYKLLWQPVDAEVSSGGDMGYTWGNYTYIYLNQEGDSVYSKGKYLNIWKKDDQNRWRVKIDMGNGNPLE